MPASRLLLFASRILAAWLLCAEAAASRCSPASDTDVSPIQLSKEHSEALAPTALANAVGVGPVGPPTHQAAYLVIGDPRTLAGRTKKFAVERRGGYPWSNGYFNRNDTAPLPKRLNARDSALACAIPISDPAAAPAKLTLRCVFFDAPVGADYELSINGHPLAVARRDADWKDPQIFSPLPQPNSGRSKPYEIDPRQHLLRIDCLVPLADWRQGPNDVEIRGTGGRVEKIEARLAYR